jgi:prepilin-type N-terminal cleavage/methylation domain-containing protein
MKQKKKRSLKPHPSNLYSSGFTLIELLVVVAIIGMLSSVVLVNLSQARSKARDVARKAAMKQMQAALEIYFDDNNGKYPCSGPSGSCSGIGWMASDPGSCCTYLPGAYIPGLAPKYISKLPSDPKSGPASALAIASIPDCAGWSSSFLYLSDGADYVLLSHCAPENPWTSTDSFYDPVRPTWAWRVSSPGSFTKGW